jgi:hypothetical protein
MNAFTNQDVIAFRVLDQNDAGFTATVSINDFCEANAYASKVTKEHHADLQQKFMKHFHQYLKKPNEKNSIYTSIGAYFYMCSVCPDFPEQVSDTIRENGTAWITVIVNKRKNRVVGVVTAEPINEEFTEFLHKSAQRVKTPMIYTSAKGWVQ